MIKQILVGVIALSMTLLISCGKMQELVRNNPVEAKEVSPSKTEVVAPKWNRTCTIITAVSALTTTASLICAYYAFRIGYNHGFYCGSNDQLTSDNTYWNGVGLQAYQLGRGLGQDEVAIPAYQAGYRDGRYYLQKEQLQKAAEIRARCQSLIPPPPEHLQYLQHQGNEQVDPVYNGGLWQTLRMLLAAQQQQAANQ